MNITGGHVILYSKDADADRAFLRDVLGFPHVDVGHGWLIFGLPPSECAVHPGSKNGVHEFFLMCADAGEFVATMRTHGVKCAPVQDRGYGLVTEITLPGGGKLGVYEPRHARPKAMAAKGAAKRRKKAAAKKPPKKPVRRATSR